MILSGEGFTKAIERGTWRAYRNEQPLTPDALTIGTNSVDVTLSDEFLDPDKAGVVIDPRNAASVDWVRYSRSELILQRNDFVLGATCERFECSEPLLVAGQYRYFVPMYEGRSTLARLGISSHQTAGFGDYGFSGTWTLELSTLLSVRLYAGMRIGQVYFIEVSSAPAKYESVYQDQVGPRAPILGAGRI